jgi:cytochrome c oxidase cbb3-type subunit 3
MSTALSVFIIILTVASIIGCLLLLRWTMNMRTGEEAEDSTGHVWDHDLKEYNNPLPKWWLYTFYLSIIFSVIYLILYPGLGNFPGVLGWTQTGQYEQQSAAANERYAEIFAAFEGQDVDDLLNSPEALRLGRNIYVNNCAACHGADGRGAISFPNLTDDTWLYGGDPVTVQLTISNGRTGNMPALGIAIGEEKTEQIVTYLLSAPDDNSAEVAAGKLAYQMSGCLGCHGPTGAEGMAAVGAPGLRDDTWLHGASRDQIKDVIMNGRVNQMPAQKDLLGEDRIRLVTAYVLSLNQNAGEN